MAFIPPIEAIDDSPTVCVQINKQWVSHVMGRVQALIQDWYWSGDENTVYDATQEGEKLMLALALGSDACAEVSMAPIGSIVIWPGDEIPENYLLCDGSFISIAEYPDLYAVIGETYGAGSGVVALPDLTARFPLGVSGSHELASTGGAETVTLTEAEMPEHEHSFGSHVHEVGAHTHLIPEHTHTQQPHTHSGGSLTIIKKNNSSAGGHDRFMSANNSVGTDDSVAYNLPTTGSQTPTIDARAAFNTSASAAFNTSAAAGSSGSAGADGAHNNMPPYLALNYIIRAL